MKKIVLLFFVLLNVVVYSQAKSPVLSKNQKDSVKAMIDEKTTNFVDKTTVQTITGQKNFTANKTVFGTTTNDSVGIRGSLDVDGLATVGDSLKISKNGKVRFGTGTAGSKISIPYGSISMGFGSATSLGNDLFSSIIIGGLNQENINSQTFTVADLNWFIHRPKSLYTLGGIYTDGDILLHGDTLGFGQLGGNGYFIPTNGTFYGDTITLAGVFLLNGNPLTAGGSVGNADSLGGQPASSYELQSDIDAWFNQLTPSSNALFVGKGEANRIYNNGAYSDFWIIDYVQPSYNRSANWLSSIEHKTDYYNDTLNTIAHADIVNIDGTGTPIWRTNDVNITGNEIQVNVGDLPDSTGLNWTYAGLTGNKVILSEAKKTAGGTRFPMPVYGYNFKFGSTPYYTYPYVYGYYSDLTTNTPNLETAYHFYGKGDYPSYFGGNIYTDGYLKVQDSIIVGTSTVKIYPDSVLVGGIRLAKITEAGSLDTSIVNSLIEANEDSSGQSIIGTTATIDSIITDYWNDALGGSSIDTTIVNALIEANEDTSGSAIIGTTETLDSLIMDYWNDNLGGTTWDSTYAYQRITTLESQVTALQNTVNNILAALDTCGCSASTVDNTPTAPPTSLVAHGGEYGTQIRITWTDPTASDLDSIRIYRNTTNDSTGATWIASVAENIETYTNTGRTANTTYWYWAKALDDSSNLSYLSNSDSGKTLATAVADTGFYMLDAEDGVGMLTITGAGITASTDRGFGGSSHSYKVAGLGGVLRTYADFDFPVANQNQDTIWVTYRIYIPAGTAVADGGWNYAHLLIGAGDANGDNGEFGLNSGTDIDGWQKPFGTLVSTNFSTGTWHKIEVMYIQGTGANARDYCYVDESLVYSTNTGAGTVDTDGFRFGAYNWTMATGEAIYFDNIIFSTTRLPLD